MRPNSTTTDVKNDPVPPIDDDADLGNPNPEPVDYSDPPQPEPPAPEPMGDDKRDEITRAYRAKRDAEKPLDGDDEPPTDEGGEPGEPAPAPAPEDDPELSLLVFGRRYKARRSELIDRYDLEGLPDDRIIAIAQKELAADQRLAESKERENQPRPNDNAPTGAANDQDHQPVDQLGYDPDADADERRTDEPPGGQNQPIPQEKLAELADRIQLGDSEEGQRALLEFAELVRSQSPHLSPEQIAAQVQANLAQNDQQKEIFASLGRFRESNQDLVDNPLLYDVTLKATGEEMLADLEQLGIPKEQLDPIRGNNAAIATAHRNLRLQGYELRNLDQVLDASADRIRTTFKLPKPQTNAAPARQQRPGSPQPAATPTPEQARERMSRKELAQQQPQHGGGRAAPSAQGKPKTTRDKIDEMRAARGFPRMNA